MAKQLAAHSFPAGRKATNLWRVALASFGLFSCAYTEDIPYWCSPKGPCCVQCGRHGLCNRWVSTVCRSKTRWYAAEAFCYRHNLLSSLTDDKALKSRLSELFFSWYIADNNNETHGIVRKIRGCLNVGPNTGYMPTEESFALIQNPRYCQSQISI